MGSIVFDSSSLISLTASNLDFVLEELSKKTDFYISRGVYEEIVGPGETNPNLGWSATQIKALVNSKVIEVKDIKKDSEYERIDNLVNHIFYTRYGPIQILQKGELESIFLLKELGENTLFCIDELITREIIDEAYKLKEILAKRYKAKLYLEEKKLKEFKTFVAGLKVVRSVDLIVYAFKKNYFSKFGTNKDTHLLKSILYSLKDNGCAVLHEEIDKYVENYRLSL